ncbi:hypothetical protein HPG69_004308 [Diceros bicornis minor]|uniref:Uncharacterized protein n=1 Tax=Diceros bicornis minor TaxID=77932 RepID=A0A7J7EHK7_DICBM|nr:hypothetical protein HPG69_004308 [Diceros bicornis minor]
MNEVQGSPQSLQLGGAVQGAHQGQVSPQMSRAEAHPGSPTPVAPVSLCTPVPTATLTPTSPKGLLVHAATKPSLPVTLTAFLSDSQAATLGPAAPIPWYLPKMALRGVRLVRRKELQDPRAAGGGAPSLPPGPILNLRLPGTLQEGHRHRERDIGTGLQPRGHVWGPTCTDGRGPQQASRRPHPVPGRGPPLLRELVLPTVPASVTPRSRHH